MSNPSVAALYAQLIGIGVLWVSVHCSGMCGPIMAGLVVSSRPQHGEKAAGRQTLYDAQSVLTYQAGRAFTYAVLGATAGIIGAGAESWIQGIARVSGIFVAMALLIFGFLQFPDVKGLMEDLKRHRAKERSPQVKNQAPFSVRAVSKLFSILPSREKVGARGRMFFSGVILGLLPCSLMFWVLALSAASASPVHGAGLMVTLVALTTPVLLLAGASSGLLTGKWRRAGAYAIPIGMMFSGLWLGLISCAANEWIPHVGIPLNFSGEEFMLMLW